MQARKEWHDIFNVLEAGEKSINLYLAKTSLKNGLCGQDGGGGGP